MNEDIKGRVKVVHRKHGKFSKLLIICVNKLPRCNKCGEEMSENEFVYMCKQDPTQFWHIDCFDILNHHKSYDGMIHEDIYGVLNVDLK